MNFITSDFHIGHPNCAVKHRGFDSVEHQSEVIRNNWLSQVTKHDKVFIVGDVGYNKDASVLSFFNDLPGAKHIIMGNHDQCSIEEYLKVFYKISGMINYKMFVITHAPIHPSELRGRINIHGHLHDKVVMLNGIPDERYINANVDVNGYRLLNLDLLVEKYKGTL